MATGRDAKGRKQYLYHPAFAAMRDAAKYDHLAEFVMTLPKLRRRLRRDLARSGLRREKILAAIVTLLEETLIRVGNEEYARANHSFGLTTLRNRHVRVRGPELTFLFQGKSGKKWNLSLRDRRVARVIRSCQELPGQHLFEYRDDDGSVHAVSSSDVNDYLRRITGRDVSAKDFRTWAGTVMAAMALARRPGNSGRRGLGDRRGLGGRRGLSAVVAEVAEALGNTAAVCRKCYIHPAIIAGYETGSLRLSAPRRRRPGLSAAEQAVLAFLKRRDGGRLDLSRIVSK
jgi:DNA topoisomerase-1